jgi:hypothetical protein
MKWEIEADSGAARNIRDGVLGSRKIGLCHQSCTVLDGTVQKKKNQQPYIWVHVEKKSSLASDQSVMYTSPCAPCPIDIAVMTTVTPAY